MQNKEIDPRIAEADARLRARFDRLDTSALSPFKREQELDRTTIAMRLLEFLCNANDWSMGQEVPAEDALAGFRVFDNLDWFAKRGVITELRTYDENSDMMKTVRKLVFDLLVGNPV